MVPLTIDTLMIFFLASSMPFLMASGTSVLLPMPLPTRPLRSPITTRAEKRMFLPPLTVLETRLIWITLSSNSFFSSLDLFLSKAIIFSSCLEIKAGFSCRLCERLNTSVVEVSATIENNILDLLCSCTLCNELAYCGSSLNVAAVA